MNETRRRSIAKALRDRPMTVMEISRQFGIPFKLAQADVEHIRRSLRGGYAGEKFYVRESACVSCGFAFRGRARLTAPSRCPICRSERVGEPEFSISGGPRPAIDAKAKP
jgi:predicted Zn-ribbon and HTH transcriptional regulator